MRADPINLTASAAVAVPESTVRVSRLCHSGRGRGCRYFPPQCASLRCLQRNMNASETPNLSGYPHTAVARRRASVPNRFYEASPPDLVSTRFTGIVRSVDRVSSGIGMWMLRTPSVYAASTSSTGIVPGRRTVRRNDP